MAKYQITSSEETHLPTACKQRRALKWNTTTSNNNLQYCCGSGVNGAITPPLKFIMLEIFFVSEKFFFQKIQKKLALKLDRQFWRNFEAKLKLRAPIISSDKNRKYGTSFPSAGTFPTHHTTADVYYLPLPLVAWPPLSSPELACEYDLWMIPVHHWMRPCIASRPSWS